MGIGRKKSKKSGTKAAVSVPKLETTPFKKGKKSGGKKVKSVKPEIAQEIKKEISENTLTKTVKESAALRKMNEWLAVLRYIAHEENVPGEEKVVLLKCSKAAGGIPRIEHRFVRYVTNCGLKNVQPEVCVKVFQFAAEKFADKDYVKKAMSSEHAHPVEKRKKRKRRSGKEIRGRRHNKSAEEEKAGEQGEQQVENTKEKKDKKGKQKEKEIVKEMEQNEEADKENKQAGEKNKKAGKKNKKGKRTKGLQEEAMDVEQVEQMDCD